MAFCNGNSPRPRQHGIRQLAAFRTVDGRLDAILRAWAPGDGLTKLAKTYEIALG